tara:strand:- start:884 stop:2926 length:2043 start_codon:yes stop_codon:yes gene_type:complete
MANWTVTESSTAVAQGATVSASVVLTILPLTGFVVSASNFRIGGATNTSGNIWAGGNVDIGINTVTFADTTTAGAVGNTVTATVAFDSFAMPGNLKQLYIDIDEIAEVENVDRFFCVRTQHLAETDDKGINKHIVTYASAPTGITTTNNTPLVHNIGDGLVEHSHQGIVVQGPTPPGELILSVDFDANELFGYHYVSEPTFSTVTGAYSSYYTFINSGHVYNTNGKLIFVNIKGYYTPPVGITGLDPDPAGSASAMCELGQLARATHVIRQEEQGEPGSVAQVTDVIIDSSIIPANGETRTLDIIGDLAAACTFKVVSSDSSKTYDFGPTDPNATAYEVTNGTFTAAATEQEVFSFGTVGNPQETIIFPAVSSNTHYDIIVTPTPPATATSNVPTAANQLRIYQYPVIKVTLELLDGAGVYDDAEFFVSEGNVKSEIVGKAGSTSREPITREFSYTILPAMVTDAGTNTLAVKATLDTSFDNTGSLSTLLNGNASGTSFEVDTNVGVVAGSTINWSVQKTSVFTSENSNVVHIADFDINADPAVSLTANTSNVVVGMELSGSGIPRDVVVETIQDGAVTLNEGIKFKPGNPITFTTAGITASSVNANGTTVVASQTMAGVLDNFEITFGGTESDVLSNVLDTTVTKVGDNIIIAGKFQVSSFPIADTVVKLDLNKLITLS